MGKANEGELRNESILNINISVMVLYILKKKILTFSNTLENFISKEISALAKYLGDNGELWTADTEHPSLTEPKVTLAFTDHSFARGPERTCSMRSPACCIYNAQQQT